MSDDNESDGQVINFPPPGGIFDRPPQLADPGRLFPNPDIPPESPEETTMRLPVIPAAPDPSAALHSDGMPSVDPRNGADDEEYEDGEYVQPRSLVDRLGDWLEYRLEVARERHAGEAPFREAEIARKAALIEARTAQETALMEQNAKLHAARAKAKGDRAAARGKADAARSGSGMGADKGGRSKAGGGGGSRGGGGSSGGSGGGRGPGVNGSGGSGRGNSPKGTVKGPDRSAGGRGGGSKGNESSGGPKGRQNGAGRSGNSGSGKGSSGGSGGKNGSGGSGKGGSKDSPASTPRAERARGRQDRAAARQAARLADRSKDRDQDRANQQAAREERRAAKAERKAARKAKHQAAKAAGDRTTFGEALTDEARRRWDKRRADSKDSKDSKGKEKNDGTEKVDLTKDKAKDKAKGKAGGGKPGESDDRKTSEPDGGTSSGSAKKPRTPRKPRIRRRRPDTGRPRRKRTPRAKRTSRKGRRQSRWEQDYWQRIGEFWWDWDGSSYSRPPKRAAADEDDIEDADIVEDGPSAVTTGVRGLPPAPEPHTRRPSTTRPISQEDPLASEVSTPVSGKAAMAAQHRTDITFGEYLMEIVNIAIASGLDRDRAQDLAVALGKVADALRDMATDLVGDHNIATEVVGQVTDLADAADRMKQRAERAATECEFASEAARLAAVSVGRVYGEDIQAMDDAGLAHASAAAHHD